MTRTTWCDSDGCVSLQSAKPVPSRRAWPRERENIIPATLNSCRSSRRTSRRREIPPESPPEFPPPPGNPFGNGIPAAPRACCSLGARGELPARPSRSATRITAACDSDPLARSPWRPAPPPPPPTTRHPRRRRRRRRRPARIAQCSWHTWMCRMRIAGVRKGAPATVQTNRHGLACDGQGILQRSSGGGNLVHIRFQFQALSHLYTLLLKSN